MKKHTIEKQLSQSEQVITKKENPNQPVFRIRENKEIESFIVDFAIDLAGVAYGSNQSSGTIERDLEMDRANRERYRNSMLSGLFDSHIVKFIYTVGTNDSGNTHFAWRVKGSSIGHSPEQAKEKAIRLWQNLNVIFGATEKDYRFIPITDPSLLDDSSPDKYWIGTIRPAGITMNLDKREPVGFLREGQIDRDAQIIMPFYPAKSAIRNLDSIVLGAYGCRVPVRIELSVSPFTISENAQELIEEALRSLRRGNSKSVKGEMTQKNKDDEENDDNDSVKLEDELETWSKNPVGLIVNCTVTSSESIPLSYLSMIGSEIFKGAPVAIEARYCGENGNGKKPLKTDISEEIEPDLLDLRGCINASYGLPVLFPHPKTLRDAGVRRVFAQTALESSTGIVVGYVDTISGRKRVRLSNLDRSRHSYIIGSTGTGKSTLLYNMIRQDILNGEGVTVIDPHGELYNDVLNSIPKSRIDDVVLIDPSDFEYSIGLNFLECGRDEFRQSKMNYITNEMIMIFDRLYDLRETGGPIFEQYMRNSLLLLMDSDFPGATLMEVPLLFEDRDFRRFLLEKCKSPYVKTFWKKQAERAGGDASLENVGPYITSKLNQFTNNGLLRPIIGQSKTTVDFRKAMDQGKIILVNLPKGLLGEMDTQLLGMLLLGKLFVSAMSRIKIPREERRPMYLYVDEFQNFTTDSIAYMLSEARKFGISLTFANQNLSQIDSNNKGKHNILDAVLGNVGSAMIFRLGPKDSEKMASYVKPEFSAQDLQELPDFHVAARLLCKNTPSRPVVFKTLPMGYTSESVQPHLHVTMSRSKYAMATSLAEKQIFTRRSDYD